MYLVSIILLLYYIGTKKKLFFIPPPIVPTPPPLLLVFGEIFNPPSRPRLFQTPRLFGTREYLDPKNKGRS